MKNFFLFLFLLIAASASAQFSNVNAVRLLNNGTGAGTVNGTMKFDTGLGKFQFREGGSWLGILPLDGSLNLLQTTSIVIPSAVNRTFGVSSYNLTSLQVQQTSSGKNSVLLMNESSTIGQYVIFMLDVDGSRWADLQGGARFQDNRTVKKGIEYYVAGYEGSDLSLTSRGYVLGAKTFTGKQTFLTSTTGAAAINIPNGSTPTVPVDNDLWGQGNHLWARLSGVTYQLDQQTFSNTAAANELMKSNGTTAVGSGSFSTAAGDITMGTGTAGATRNLTADGSAANVGLTLTTKGTGATTLTSATGIVNVTGGPSATTGVAGSQVNVTGGSASVGDANGGAVILTGGSSAGTGVPGFIQLNAANGASSGIGGGLVSINGGAGTSGNALGGGVSLTGGTSAGTSTGGPVTITGGQNGGAGQAGSVTVQGGFVSGTGTGAGAVNVKGGSSSIASIAGGDVSILGGTPQTGNTNGGNVSVAGGINVGTGVPGQATVKGGTSVTTAIAAGDIILQGGDASVGNANGGNAYLTGGGKFGSGTFGNVGLFTNSGTFGAGEKVLFWGDATTNPTTNPTSGSVVFLKSADHLPYVRTPAGVEYSMAATIGLFSNIVNGYTLASPGTTYVLTGNNTWLPYLPSNTTVTSGSSSTIADATGLSPIVVLTNPSSLIASYTFTMPAAPIDGQEVNFFFGGTITNGNTVVTTLTISANAGQSMSQSITPVSAKSGDSFTYIYRTGTTTWNRKF